MLKPLNPSHTPYQEIKSGQRQIPEHWTERRLFSRKFMLLRMKKKREEEIKKFQKIIAEYQSHIESIDTEMVQLKTTLKERMKESPKNTDSVILIRTKTGYTKGKIKYMHKWRWVHLGVTKYIEGDLGYSDEKLKKMVVDGLKKQIVGYK